MAAFGLCACSATAPESASTTTTAPAVAATPAPTGLPPTDALTDVLAKLSDPAVAGADKLVLVEGATDAEAADLDTFARALRDNRMLPLTFAATDLIWSPDTPGDVTANVTVTPADPAVAPFTYPMEFTPASGGWQLSRQTADLLLNSSADTAGPDKASPSTTAPTTTPTR